MSKELVRFKYKKVILNSIEESWDYYGKEDEMRKVIKELKNVYKIASSAKNAPKPELQAKAEAYDRIVNQRNQAGADMYGKEDEVVDGVIESAFWNIDGIIVEYESGEME